MVPMPKVARLHTKPLWLTAMDNVAVGLTVFIDIVAERSALLELLSTVKLNEDAAPLVGACNHVALEGTMDVVQEVGAEHVLNEAVNVAGAGLANAATLIVE